MRSGSKDQAEGKLHKMKGKVKEIAGKLGGDSDLEAEGKGERLAGKTSTFIIFQTPEEGIGFPMSLAGFGEGYDKLP